MKRSNVAARSIFSLAIMFVTVFLMRAESGDRRTSAPHTKSAPSAPLLLYGSTGDVNASGGGRLWLIDVTSQSATLVGNTGFDRLGGIAFDSNGTLYGVSGGAVHPPSTLLTIDPTNGQATVIGSISDPTQGVDGLRFNSQGVLYGSSWDNNVSIGKLLTIDPSNADVLTSLTLTGDGDAFCAGIAFDPLDVLYGSRGGGSHDADIDLIDPVTGVLTPIGPRETTISDITFAPDGTLYASSPTGDLYTVDPLTGAKTLLFNTGIAQLSGLAAAPPIASPHDFNGDGKADILWQNNVTGQRVIWLMNGTTYQSSVGLGTVPTSWSIRNY
jgi:hypothetical protein